MPPPPMAPHAGNPALSYHTHIIFVLVRKFAGTDADVFVNIVGEQGETGKIVLGESSTNNNALERNQEDVFTVEGKPVGKISKVTIGNYSIILYFY